MTLDDTIARPSELRDAVGGEIEVTNVAGTPLRAASYGNDPDDGLPPSVYLEFSG